MSFDFSILTAFWPLFARGLFITIAASGLALVFSLLFGVVVVLARIARNRIASYAAIVFVEIMRDLPFMLVLFLIFYLLPAIGIRLPAFGIGVVTLSLYSAAYFSEIMRGAIQSVRKGQMDSARALGMSRIQALRYVIAPQMMGYFLPPATNQAVTVIKESSILSTITVTELTMAGEVVQGYTGGRIEVGKGQLLEILNVEGEQICDFFAFRRDDVSETLSPSHTRSELRRIVLKVGDVLVSRYRNPMVEIVEDTCGRHDITFPPCDPVRYERGFGLRNHRSCRTNLAEVVADLGIPYAYLPEPVNWFQNMPVTADGTIQRLNSSAAAGDKVVLRALQPLLAVGSACPMIGVNGDHPTDIRLTVRDA